MGVSEHEDGLYQLTCFYISKQRRMLSLLKRIHAMFVRVLHAEKEKRTVIESHDEALRKATQGTSFPSVLVPEAYCTPDWSVGHMVQMDPMGEQTTCNVNNTHLLDMHNFVRLTKWQPTEQGANGTSWLELFIRYQQILVSALGAGLRW